MIGTAFRRQEKGAAMAGGWAQDGAVNEQIEISTEEAVARVRAGMPQFAGESARDCVECGEPIPESRRAALPGVKLCVDCQAGRDRARRPKAGLNRRASKDSLLK